MSKSIFQGGSATVYILEEGKNLYGKEREGEGEPI